MSDRDHTDHCLSIDIGDLRHALPLPPARFDGCCGEIIETTDNQGARWRRCSACGLALVLGPLGGEAWVQTIPDRPPLLQLLSWCRANVPDGRVSLCRVTGISPCAGICGDCLLIERRACALETAHHDQAIMSPEAYRRLQWAIRGELSPRQIKRRRRRQRMAAKRRRGWR